MTQQPHPHTAVLYAEPPSALGTNDWNDPIVRWHEHCEWEVEAAWHDGYQTALADVAARHAELAATWSQHGRRRHEQAVAGRLRGMEAHAVTDWPGLDHGGVLPNADWAVARRGEDA